MLHHPWAGAGLRTLASLSGYLWHWFIFQCLNRDFSSLTSFIFPYLQLPPFHHCHSELVNIGSSARYPISLFAMQAGLVVLSISCCVDCYRNFSLFSEATLPYFSGEDRDFPSCSFIVLWPPLMVIWEERQLMCGLITVILPSPSIY